MTSAAAKKIFITARGGWVVRNILRSFVIARLLQDEQITIFLLVPEKEEEWFRREFGAPKVTVIGIPDAPSSFFRNFIAFLARYGRGGKGMRLLIEKQFFYKKDLVAYCIKRLLGFIFRGSSFHAKLVRFLARLCRIERTIAELYQREKPDGIFSTNIRESFDLEALLAAEKLGIKTMGVVRNWDSLSLPLGVLPLIPDLLLVFNSYLYEQALALHFVPQERIKIVGMPHYDWYLEKDLLKDRDSFFRSLGIDPLKSVILFASGGAAGDVVTSPDGKIPLATFEIDVVEVITRAIDKGILPRDTHVFFRPHPHYLFDVSRLHANPHVTVDDLVVPYVGEDKADVVSHQEGTAHLLNSLRHAVMLVTTTSSVIIDAAAFRKPLISVAFDGYQEKPYWESIRQFFDVPATRAILDTGGVRVVHSEKELIDAIGVYLENPRQDIAGRQKLFDEFVWKLDGRSAERIASAILNIIIKP